MALKLHLQILTLSPVPLQDKEPRGIIPLENLSVQKVDDPKKPVGIGMEARGQSGCGNFQNRVGGEGVPITPSGWLRVASVSLLGPWILGAGQWHQEGPASLTLRA